MSIISRLFALLALCVAGHGCSGGLGNLTQIALPGVRDLTVAGQNLSYEWDLASDSLSYPLASEPIVLRNTWSPEDADAPDYHVDFPTDPDFSFRAFRVHGGNRTEVTLRPETHLDHRGDPIELATITVSPGEEFEVDVRVLRCDEADRIIPLGFTRVYLDGERAARNTKDVLVSLDKSSEPEPPAPGNGVIRPGHATTHDIKMVRLAGAVGNHLAAIGSNGIELYELVNQTMVHRLDTGDTDRAAVTSSKDGTVISTVVAQTGGGIRFRAFQSSNDQLFPTQDFENPKWLLGLLSPALEPIVGPLGHIFSSLREDARYSITWTFEGPLLDGDVNFIVTTPIDAVNIGRFPTGAIAYDTSRRGLYATHFRDGAVSANLAVKSFAVGANPADPQEVVKTLSRPFDLLAIAKDYMLAFVKGTPTACLIGRDNEGLLTEELTDILLDGPPLDVAALTEAYDGSDYFALLFETKVELLAIDALGGVTRETYDLDPKRGKPSRIEWFEDGDWFDFFVLFPEDNTIRRLKEIRNLPAAK